MAFGESSASMVNIVPERGLKQPEDDRRNSSDLPYDPKEWEQRVALARAQRERVLQQRAVDARRAERTPEPAASAPPNAGRGSSSRNGKPLPGAALGAGPVRVAGPAPSPRADSREDAVGIAPLPASRRLAPLLAGLLLGSVVGGAAVILTGFDRSDLRLPAFPVVPDAPVTPPADAVAELPAASLSETRPTPPVAPLVRPAQDAARPGMRERGPQVLSDAPVLAQASQDPASRQGPAPSSPGSDAALPRAQPGPDMADGLALALSQAGLFSPPATVRDLGPRRGLDAPLPWVSRLAIHIPQGTGARESAPIMARLAGTAWPTQIIETPFAISETHVRYFHAQDRNAAEALAERLDCAARDLTHFQPSPEDGYLELWLSGEARR